MQDEEGGFFASFDADSGGEEGTYYVWTPDELRNVAGREEGEALALLLGVTEKGNFEGKSIPTRRCPAAEVARKTGIDQARVEALVDEWRPSLLELRGKRVPPGLDRKLVTSWNGLAISAMARGFAAFGHERYRVGAERAAERLWSLHRRADDGLFRSSNQGEAANEGVLGDYAFIALGLVDLFQATQELKWLQRALSLVEQVRRRFPHPEAGFYQTPEGHPAPLGRRVEMLDSVRPSGNAAMAMVLLRAGTLTGNERYRREAAAMISAFSPWLRRFGLEMAAWLDAADNLLGPLYEVVVVGPSDADQTRALVDAFRKANHSNALLVTMEGDGPEEELDRLIPAAEGKTSQGKVAAAYVCQHGTCKAPVFTAEELLQALLG